MDWFQIARDDWSFYRDISRIKEYVKRGKITKAEFKEITKQEYA